MGTLRQLKSVMKKDEDLCDLMVRSDRHEILLDLDSDKIPDIGLLDLNRDGDVNAIAVDLTGNGEFNFYLIDHDGNGIPDEISFYRDGDDMPVKSLFGRTVEAKLVRSVARIHALMTAADIAADEIMDALEELEAYIEEEYTKFAEENSEEEKDGEEKTEEEKSEE